MPRSEPNEKIGILGGTFDPVHVGHLMDASAARHQLGLDRMLVVPARDPWQKHGSVVAPAEVRFEMLVAALDGAAGLEASRLELDRDGPTYTIDTIEQLAAPDRELVLVMGSDVAATLESWHRVDDLRQLVTLAIVDRGDPAPADLEGWRVVRVRVPRMELSSTDLRRRVAAGEPIDFLVPMPAVRVLRSYGLYAHP
ncbi:MAG TPA: nicotinate-nucleotide adenylyltransferase [Acidimicrobiia bacterium]|nr:nicotinate-nucleotide adenylyltransferase [Acidimicrobiia bacterium]